jgi:sugar-specific transcriptional regulator TrmB
MDHLIEPLQNLGLTEKEAKVYLALLQLGPSTPYRIAVKAGIKRPTAYVIAEELVEKGIIVHVPGEEPKRYIARTPESVIESEEARLSSARRILPELKSLQKGAAEKPSILYFEGVEGMRQAAQYRQKELHGKEIVGFYASAEGTSPEIMEVFYEWNEYKERHKMIVRGITVDDPSLKPFRKYYESATSTIIGKYVPKDIYSSRVSVESCVDFVRIELLDSAQALIIDSPHFAEAVKQIFEMVWKSLGDKYEVPERF